MKTNIKKCLSKVGITQDAFGKKVGISQSALNHYANGKRTANTEMAWRIVNAFNELGAGLSFDDVFPNQTSK